MLKFKINNSFVIAAYFVAAVPHSIESRILFSWSEIEIEMKWNEIFI